MKIPERSWVKSSNGRILFHTREGNFRVDDHPYSQHAVVDGEEDFRVLSVEETIICENSVVYVDSVRISGDSARVVLKNYLGFKWKFDCKGFRLSVGFRFKTKDERVPFAYANWSCSGGKIFDALKDAHHLIFSINEHGKTGCLISYDRTSLKVPSQ